MEEKVTYFYFRLEKDAHVGIDTATGEPCCAYSAVKLNHTENIDVEDLAKLRESFRGDLAKLLGTDISNVTVVDKEEYDANTEEDETEEFFDHDEGEDDDDFDHDCACDCCDED